MAQILYRATGPDGQPTSGMVEADGMAQAREQLQARGLRDIAFQLGSSMAVDVKALAGDAGIDVQRMAQVVVRILERPGLRTVLAEVLRGAKLPTFGFAALGVFALWERAPLWAAGAFAIAALPFVLALWAHRRSRDYEQYLRAHAIGDLDRMRALAQRLRAMPDKPLMLAFDLDLRDAQARIRGGEDADGVLAAFGALGWRARLADRPGVYDARLAALHAAADRWADAIAAMRVAAQAANNEPVHVLDLALTEAHHGDVDAAQRLLEGVDPGLLPAHAAGFVAWTRARIADRRADPAAPGLYATAVNELLAVAAKHPAAWTALAGCAADLALVQRRAGLLDAARATLRPVAPIVRAHAPRAELAELSDLLPPARA